MPLPARHLLPLLMLTALPAAASKLPLSFNATTAWRTTFQPCGVQQPLGAARGDGLQITRLRWVQTAALDPDDSNTVLAGGKNTLVRVDLTASRAGVKAPIVKLFLRDATSNACTTLMLRGPAIVPTSSDTSSLNTSYSTVIPAARMQPGLRIVTLAIDSGRSSSELDKLIRADAPTVLAPISEQIRLIPLSLAGRTATLPSASLVQSLLQRLYPVANATISNDPVLPVTALASMTGDGTLDQYRSALSAVDARCRKINLIVTNARTAIKCMGFIPDNVFFRPAGQPNAYYSGLSFVGGVSLIAYAPKSLDAASVSSAYLGAHWITREAKSLAHEFGHLMNLNHGACGNTGSIDSRLPTDGLLHGEGWDADRSLYFSSSASTPTPFSDVMSYCDKGWVSPQGYEAALRYRSSTDAAARTTGAAESTAWVEIRHDASGWSASLNPLMPGRMAQDTLAVKVAGTTSNLTAYSAVLSEGDSNPSGPWYVSVPVIGATQLLLQAPGQNSLIPVAIKR